MSGGWLPWAGAALVGLGGGILGAALATVEPAPQPSEGRRGMERGRALERSLLFAALDPLVRRAAPLCERLLRPAHLAKLDDLLEHAGCFLGLGAAELAGLSLIGSLVFAALAFVIGSALGSTQALVVIGVPLGAFAPFLRLSNATLERHKSIARDLPAAIDLAALCMGAGMDFPASLRQAVLQHRGNDSPLRQELLHMLRGLDMGQTRAEVLQRFARLTPTASVREFVAAVVQSEARGTPPARGVADPGQHIAHAPQRGGRGSRR